MKAWNGFFSWQEITHHSLCCITVLPKTWRKICICFSYASSSIIWSELSKWKLINMIKKIVEICVTATAVGFRFNSKYIFWSRQRTGERKQLDQASRKIQHCNWRRYVDMHMLIFMATNRQRFSKMKQNREKEHLINSQIWHKIWFVFIWSSAHGSFKRLQTLNVSISLH